MYNSNKRGGAALVAVLIMMILVAVGVAVMIITGKGNIDEADNVPAFTPTSESAADSKPDESSAPDDSGTESQPDSSKPDDSSVPQNSVALTEAETFKEIDYKAANMTGKYAILVSADDMKILAGINHEKKIYPASMTKVMTIIVAAENIKDPDSKYKFTKQMLDDLSNQGASMAGFAANEEVAFIDLLYGAILQSGADATTGLANLVAGSETDFVALMNKKAEEMGLETTHFTNCSGLHDKEHYSSCKDMATILCYALKNETCKKVLTTHKYTTAKTPQHPDGVKLSSTVLDSFSGYYVDLGLDGKKDGEILGGKSGFTDEAGNALETVYEYNGKTYISVVTKCTSKNAAVIDNMAVYERNLSK